MKAHNEKKTILNIPTAFDDDPKKRKKMDEDFIIESFEKMRDYIQQELKKVKDEQFRQHIDFETKVREKIDKKELEEIESNRHSSYLDRAYHGECGPDSDDTD